MRVMLIAAGVTLSLVAASHTAGLKFYADDPVLEDVDRLDTPVKPAEAELSQLFDRFGHTFHDFGSSQSLEAANVNTLDEVPNSAWFANRHGRERMSLEELARGPNTGPGPDTTGPWRIFRSKTEGVTPGFHIKDARGDRYVIKFDPVEFLELSSAAEVIATKLFYASGYNVPENYIARVHPEALTIEPGTSWQDRFGDKRPLTTELLRRVLSRVPRLSDGRIRVLASKYVPGALLGPFRYYGTRSDDPNDVVPHEHRRELRGLRLLAAWTNHDDSRAHNTLDTWVEEDGRHYVRHYLIDFGSTFGSGSVDLQLPQLGFHSWLDTALLTKNALSLGLHVPAYRKVTWPEFPKFASVGRFEAKVFEPQKWKSEYPNPAFVRMTDRDALWAAKIIARFTPDDLRAIVKTGEYSDPAAEQYFFETLLERQRKTVVYYLNRVNPLDEFQVTDAGLEFENLSERQEFAPADTTTYRVTWHLYDNVTGGGEPLTEPRTSRQRAAPLPLKTVLRPETQFLLAEIDSLHEDHPSWNTSIRVYLRQTDLGFTVVGVERG